ncbi:hypothetical protein D0T50_07320 [Bacteroides sp. 214]|uniref:hypothetical protein n=1 Tax=Bacteroides sp. 214 TaxID=2302935 RepID=UPI001940277C|nr:hypothetical protein [Bacteroides sp. 214]NDW12697.1 hypothetical protein [Bacteroides sp. 214]
MEASTLFVVSAIWLVVIISLVCVFYMVLLIREQYNPEERALQKGALLYFICFTGICLARFSYKWYPELFVMFAPLLYACHTCSGTMFYYIVFALTSKEKRPFPRIHSILPFVIPTILFVWMPFIPFDVPLGIVKGMGALNADWPIFSHVFTTLTLAEILYTGGYLIASFVRLHRYHRSLSRAKRENAHYQMRWVSAMGIFILITLIQPFVAFIATPEIIYSTYWFVLLMITAIAAMEIMLLYNLQLNNYPPLGIKKERKKKEKPTPLSEKAILKQLSRRDFDYYFKHEKPYLDPTLKLTSLAAALGVSREELSRFINQTYKMHFNAFLGYWRLKELEHLRKLKTNEGVPLKSLLEQAGFAYYNSYMRARQEHEERKTK